MNIIKTTTRILALTTLAIAINACGDKISSASAATATTTNNTASSAQKNDAQELKVIKVAYLPITHSLPVLALAEHAEEAKPLGFKVELVRYGSWPELLDALNTGSVDAAPVLAELAMKAREQGIGLTAAASGHRDGNVFIASEKVKTAADLKGRTIAIPHRQSSHYLLLLEVLKKAGLTKDDIKITELAPAEMPSALASGQIDAYCVAEPFGAAAETIGIGHVLFTSHELWPDSLCCLLVLNNKFLTNEPLLAKNFLSLYHKIGKSLADKEQALEIASKYLKQNQTTLKKSLEWISFADLSITSETYELLTDKVRDAGLSSNPPAYKDFVIHE